MFPLIFSMITFSSNAVIDMNARQLYACVNTRISGIATIHRKWSFAWSRNVAFAEFRSCLISFVSVSVVQRGTAPCYFSYLIFTWDILRSNVISEKFICETCFSSSSSSSSKRWHSGSAWSLSLSRQAIIRSCSVFGHYFQRVQWTFM